MRSIAVGLLRHRVVGASALRVGALSAGVGASVLVARLGGPDVKGVTSAFAATAIIGAMLVNVDLPQQLLRFGRETGSVDVSRSRLVRFWPWYAGLAVLVGAAALALGRPHLAWLVAGTFAYLLATQAGVVCTGLAGPRTTSLGSLVQQVGLASAVLVAVATGTLTIATAPLLVVVSFLAPVPLYLRASRPRRASEGPRAVAPRVRSLFASGARWQAARLAQLLLLRLDTVVVFEVLGPGPAGIYSVGLATAGLAGIVPSQFASNTVYEATSGTGGSVRRDLLGAVASGSVGALALALVGWPLLRIAYGPAFSSSYAVLLCALPGIVAYGALQVFTNHTRIVGRARTVLVPSLVGVVVMAGGLLVLTSRVGTAGAAVASSVGATTAVLVAWLGSRGRRPRPDAPEPRPAEPRPAQPRAVEVVEVSPTPGVAV